MAIPELLPDRVLVADDEHVIATDLADSLGQLGIEVVAVVSDGEQAIEGVKAHKPDMALLDIRMPKLDGLAATGVISREMGCPVVILSAYSAPEQAAAAAKAGAYGYLIKPIGVDELRVSLTVAWSRYNEHQQTRLGLQEMEQKMEDRKVIEIAKGKLMKWQDLEEPEALSRLRKMARDARRPLADMARAVLETESLR